MVCSVVANQCHSTGVAIPRMNVQSSGTEKSPLLLGEGAERSEAGVEGTQWDNRTLLIDVPGSLHHPARLRRATFLQQEEDTLCPVGLYVHPGPT